MKKLLLYIFILPSSIPELRKKIKEGEIGGTTYIGSVIQNKKGEMIYEGITPEFKRKIQGLVKRISQDLWLESGRLIKVKTGQKIIDVLHQNIAYPIKPEDRFFLNALEKEINFGHYQIDGMEISAELKYDTIEEMKEDIRKRRVEFPSEEILTMEEFIEKYPDWAHLIKNLKAANGEGANG